MSFPKTLEKQMMASGLMPNMISGAIMMPYIFCYSGVGFSNMIISMIIGVIVMGILQVFLAPITNNKITKVTSDKILEWEESCLSKDERTELVKSIMGIPKYIAYEVIIIFLFGCCVWIVLSYFFANFTIQNCIYAAAASCFGTIISALFSLNMAEKVCSNYAKYIVADDIQPEEMEKIKGYGLGLTTLFKSYVILPMVISTVLLTFSVWSAFLSDSNWFMHLEYKSSIERSIRVLAIFIVNLFLTSVLAIMFFKNIKIHILDMGNTLFEINKSSALTAKLIDCDYSNEISYNTYLINETIKLFRKMLSKASEIGESVMQSTQDLVITSRETESISVEQSSSVKEIVATMEDSDKLSQNIASRIAEVAMVANKTANDVQEGFETLAVNLNKMNEITDANVETISGIKLLSEKIENIWDIVSIINGIADQTKIIAFNAELEAASAGEAGKNFHIVANEIRRLADGTMESTREIKDRITEIQHSSDNLIITSEGGTEKIHEGCELSAKLENNFANIKSSAEVTAESSNDIKDIIEQQTAAFEQIVITLKQISVSIESFSESTQTVTQASENLKKIADQLNDLEKTV